jgi:LPS sulfotransferase NodH
MFFPILTYTRSGSTWLADSVSNRGMWGIDKSKPGDVICLHEYFTNNVGNDRLIRLGHLASDIDTRRIEGFKILKNYILSKNIHFTFKFFNRHIPFHKDKDNKILSVHDLIDSSDFVIHNYRLNILNSWISRQRVAAAGEWQGRNMNDNYDNVIYWNKKHFLNYSNNRKNTFDKWNIALKNVKHIDIVYEDLHNSNDKKHFLQQKFDTINVDLKIYDSKITKFSKTFENIADNFVNKDDFLRDYDSIRGNIYLKDPNQT